MADSVSLQIHGADELRRSLEALPERLRKKALTKPLREAAKLVQKEARALVPVLNSPFPNPYRKKGTLKRRITVRVSKRDKRAGNVGVFVNIKPIKGGGATNPADPYYWRWVEFGTARHVIRPKTVRALKVPGRGVFKRISHPGAPEKPFLRPAAEKLPEALKIFEREAGPAIQALNTPRP